MLIETEKLQKPKEKSISLILRHLCEISTVLRQFNIEVQFVKSVNYTFEQSL